MYSPDPHRPFGRQFWFSLFALFLFLSAPLVAKSQIDPQGTRRDPTRPLTEAERQRKLERDLEDREYRMRVLEAGKMDPGVDREITPGMRRQMLLADIQRGWQQLDLNNQRLQEALKQQAPDYKRVASCAGEMRKAAQLLQTSLAAPKPERKEEKPEPELIASAEQLKGSILTLDQLAKEVLGSQVLQQPHAVDVEILTKAGRDLDAILKHAARAKKIAEALRARP